MWIDILKSLKLLLRCPVTTEVKSIFYAPCNNHIIDNICENDTKRVTRSFYHTETETPLFKFKSGWYIFKVHSISELRHYRFFTNDILHKIKLKDNNICSMCNAENSKFHMLVECNRSKDLWIEVKNWISALGMVDYYVTNRKKIIGDLVKSGQINIIILNTKKTFFIASWMVYELTKTKLCISMRSP